MSPIEIIGAILFFLGVPFLGVVVYALLCLRMYRLKVESPPYRSYFLLFAFYGASLMGALLVAIHPKQWSGMHSLGGFFLIFIAPIVTLVMMWNLRKRRAISPFHRYAYLASAAYSLLMALLVVCLLISIVVYQTVYA